MVKRIKKFTKNDKAVSENDKKLTSTANDFLDKTNHTPEAEMVRKAYNDVDCLYGIYSPYYYSLFKQIFFGFFLTCYTLLMIGLFIFLMVKYTSVGMCIAMSIGCLIMCAIWVYALAAMRNRVRKVYFYKHNGKAFTIHFCKYCKYFGVCVEDDKFFLYKFKNDSWSENEKQYLDKDMFMGTYLLFPYLFTQNIKKDGVLFECKNKIKKCSNNVTKVISSQYKERGREFQTTYLFKNDKLVNIKYSRYIKGMSSIVGQGSRTTIITQYLRIYETNVIHCMEIPKSFIDFCKSQGIDPPEECEHLHYVDIVKNK